MLPLALGVLAQRAKDLLVVMGIREPMAAVGVVRVLSELMQPELLRVMAVEVFSQIFQERQFKEPVEAGVVETHRRELAVLVVAVLVLRAIHHPKPGLETLILAVVVVVRVDLKRYLAAGRAVLV